MHPLINPINARSADGHVRSNRSADGHVRSMRGQPNGLAGLKTRAPFHRSADDHVRSMRGQLSGLAGLKTRAPGRALSRTPMELGPVQGALFILCLVLFWVASATTSFAQVTVKTLGGGPINWDGPAYGDQDGNTLEQAQFHTPFGCALDGAGNLFVADRDNGKVRKLDINGNRTRTILAGLNQPVALALDATNNLFIVNQGDGTVLKYDRFALVTTVASGLISPTAIALDASGNLCLTELTGAIKRINPLNGSIALITNGLKQPRGIAVLDSGLLAVSETGNHSLRLLDPASGATIQQIGTGVRGFRDGPSAFAQFNLPYQLAKAPSGNLVVADRGNDCARIVGFDGSVTTLYGVDPVQWISDFPGWEDGDAEFAEAREPVGITVATNGTVYATEAYYHLVRQITGSGLTAPSPGGPGGGAGTNLVANAPVLVPDSGYYPMGQTITVLDPNTNAFFSSRLYYTADGSEPTTNSLPVPLTNHTGAITWHESTRDLSSLRVTVFLGNAAAATVSGQSVATNQIGLTRDIVAGIGATVVVPVIVNLRTNDPLRSLQFRVEVAPRLGTPAAPPILNQLRTLNLEPSRDFIPLSAPSDSGTIVPSYANPYSLTNLSDGIITRGLAISYVGSNANFLVRNFAAVALLAVPVPPTASVGARYQIQILQPSGTADGLQAAVPLVSLPPRELRITNLAYGVGDSTPGTWYNAGDFGTGNPWFGAADFGSFPLNNNDVNNAFYASLGVSVPFPLSDLFDAMDAFPLDSLGAVGGDGQIRFLDWQVILQRSLRLDALNWKRSWTTGGKRTALSASFNAAPQWPAVRLNAPVSPTAWFRHATLGAVPVENVKPAGPTDVPVYIKVAAGYQLAGLQFRAAINPDGAAPELDQTLQFIPAPDFPGPSQSMAPSVNVLLCSWPLVPAPAFAPPLQGSNRLGVIRFAVPATAQPRQRYILRFAYADGAPDLTTQYDFESIPASVWIETQALQPPEWVSDEWRIHFFNNLTNSLALAEADPDGDGLPNAIEYLAGTDPRQYDWRFQVLNGSLRVRWFAEPGRRHVLERSPDLNQWTPLGPAFDGAGRLREFSDTLSAPTQFYRLHTLP